MYRYRFDPEITKRFSYEYIKSIGITDYYEWVACWYARGEVFYSKNKLLLVPSSNGILLPVKLFIEEEI